MQKTLANNDTFCLPADYQVNAAVRPSDRESEYWTERRIATSALYQHQVYCLARSLAERRQCSAVLDVGCGVGTKLNQHFDSAFSLVGIDQADAIEHCARLYPDHRWLTDDLDEPNLCTADLGVDIDLMICADVIEHLGSPEVLLRHLLKLSSPQTLLILSTPDRDRLVGRQAKHPSIPEHLREWNIREFREFVELSGWRVLNQRIVFPFRMRPDRFTLRYFASRLSRGKALRTCQVAVCSPGEVS
ncbi:MAG: class I SAM-dependent methyltransferase [Fuerstiella sp.]|nr:class I SAM-dependent methyltransferase [Fuerstiella sp.]